MSMSKKDFIELADAIVRHNKYANDLDTKFTREQINVLASVCQSSNPAFKRERWLGYIAGENGKNGGKAKD